MDVFPAKDFGGFEYGEWLVEDKVLVLKPAGGKERRVLMKQLTDKELVADLDPKATHKRQFVSAFQQMQANVKYAK